MEGLGLTVCLHMDGSQSEAGSQRVTSGSGGALPSPLGSETQMSETRFTALLKITMLMSKLVSHALKARERLICLHRDL